MNALRVLDPTTPNQIPRGLCALAVMTKAPRPGQVKTRLAPPLTHHEAAELNKCFLRDTAAAISSVSQRHARGVAVYTPVGAEAAYTNILRREFTLLPQRGQEFGERLYCAAYDLFKCGFESVCLIDSDSPTVPAENYAHAAEVLRSKADCVVVGPCDDGGYYLIGMNKLHREIFEHIDWSTERVLEQTIRRAHETGIEINLLATGYDVDDEASLLRLSAELLSHTTKNTAARHTQKFLHDLVAHKQL